MVSPVCAPNALDSDARGCAYRRGRLTLVWASAWTLTLTLTLALESTLACSGPAAERGGASHTAESPGESPGDAIDPSAQSNVAPSANTAPHAAIGADAAATPAPDETPAPNPLAALSAADCRALRDAPALAVVEVTASRPDCSGVGHARMVFQVRELLRGADIARVSASRPLYGIRTDRLGEGDVLVARIAPQRLAAETRYCVPLPARDGRATDWVKVADVATGVRLADALLAADAPCANLADDP